MKKVLTIGLALLIIGLGVGYFMWNKPHENIEKAKADIAMSAAELFDAFEKDENAANGQFLDKVVSVTGTIRSVELDQEVKKVVLDSNDEMFGIICELDALSTPKRLDFKVGEQVNFKGKCTGMLMDVVIVRCVEI